MSDRFIMLRLTGCDDIFNILKDCWAGGLFLFYHKINASYWMRGINLGESVESCFGVCNQVLLLGTHGEERL